MKRSMMIEVSRWIAAAAVAGTMAGCFAQTSGECGNGFLEAGEYCDDGNRAEGDSCPVNCQEPAPTGPMAQPDPDEPDAGKDDGDATVGTSAVVINEFVFDHTGTDTSEFIEIYGARDTDYSDLTLVVIEGDAGGGQAGVLTAVLPAGKTNAGGYFATGFMGNQLQNGTQTLALVDGFTGAKGIDLDAEDDGELDSAPWRSVIDAVAVVDDNGGVVYVGAPTLPRELPVLDPSAATVAGGSRVPDGADTDAIGDWHRNDFQGSGLPCCGVTRGLAGEALNTPGSPNAVIP